MVMERRRSKEETLGDSCWGLQRIGEFLCVTLELNIALLPIA